MISLHSSFDFCASVLGAISTDAAAAKEAARVAAAFYISSMAPELVERHGIAYEEVRPVADAFARGDVEHALALTTSQIGERLSIAGEPGDWIDRIRADVAPQGVQPHCARPRRSLPRSELVGAARRRPSQSPGSTCAVRS